MCQEVGSFEGSCEDVSRCEYTSLVPEYSLDSYNLEMEKPEVLISNGMESFTFATVNFSTIQ